MITGASDLAQYMALRSANGQTSAKFEAAAATVAEGKIQNLRASLQADFKPLNAVQNTLSRLAAYSGASTQAAFFVDQQQSALDMISDLSTGLAQDLVAAHEAEATGTLDTISEGARSAFTQAVSTLNYAAGGRYLFSGANVTDAPLPAGEDMLATLEVEIAGMSHADAASHIHAFFTDDAGGYAAAYTGASDERIAFTIAPGQTVRSDVTALSPDLRQSLAAMATGALVSNADQAVTAGADLLSGAQAIADTRGTLGMVQERIETVQTRNGATATAMELRLAELTTPDMYEAATELENYEMALERLYLVTSRVSAMNFAEFM